MKSNLGSGEKYTIVQRREQEYATTSGNSMIITMTLLLIIKIQTYSSLEEKIHNIY